MSHETCSAGSADLAPRTSRLRGHENCPRRDLNPCYRRERPVSWAELAEYALQVPANRIGYRVFTLAQLKIIQEIITMTVFAGYAVLWAGEVLRWNYAAATVCLVAAAVFIFRY